MSVTISTPLEPIGGKTGSNIGECAATYEVNMESSVPTFKKSPGTDAKQQNGLGFSNMFSNIRQTMSSWRNMFNPSSVVWLNEIPTENYYKNTDFQQNQTNERLHQHCPPVENNLENTHIPWFAKSSPQKSAMNPPHIENTLENTSIPWFAKSSPKKSTMNPNAHPYSPVIKSSLCDKYDSLMYKNPKSKPLNPEAKEYIPLKQSSSGKNSTNIEIENIKNHFNLSYENSYISDNINMQSPDSFCILSGPNYDQYSHQDIYLQGPFLPCNTSESYENSELSYVTSFDDSYFMDQSFYSCNTDFCSEEEGFEIVGNIQFNMMGPDFNEELEYIHYQEVIQDSINNDSTQSCIEEEETKIEDLESKDEVGLKFNETETDEENILFEDDKEGEEEGPFKILESSNEIVFEHESEDDINNKSISLNKSSSSSEFEEESDDEIVFESDEEINYLDDEEEKPEVQKPIINIISSRTCVRSFFVGDSDDSDSESDSEEENEADTEDECDDVDFNFGLDNSWGFGGGLIACTLTSSSTTCKPSLVTVCEFTDIIGSFNDVPDGNCDNDRKKYLETINKTWEKEVMENNAQPTEKRVNFVDKPDVKVMHTWLFARRKARKGEWEMYARDRSRFKNRISSLEPILSPILDCSHRKNIYFHLYKEEL